MAELISAVGSLVTAAVSWVGSFAGMFTASTEGQLNNPILVLFCVAVPLVGLGVGLLKRLIAVR